MPGARRRVREVTRDRGVHARETEVEERHGVRFVVGPTAKAPTEWVIGPRTRAQELLVGQREKLIDRLSENYPSFADNPERYRFALAEVKATEKDAKGEPVRDAEGRFVQKTVPQVFVIDKAKGSRVLPLNSEIMNFLRAEGVPGLFEPSKPLKGRMKTGQKKP